MKKFGKILIAFILVLSLGFLVGCSCEDAKLEGIEVTPASLTLDADEIQQLEVKPVPEGVALPAASFTSSDSTVASVGKDGKVMGIKAGTAEITVKAGDFEKKVAVTVNPILASDLTVPAALEVKVGATATINYTIAPANVTNKVATFTTSDASIATVDAEGVVTGVAGGTATITVKADAIEKGVAVTVVPAVALESITLKQEDQNLNLGQTLQLSCTLVPEDTGLAVSYASSDEAVATVSSSGLVTAVGVGTATITASAGGKSDTIEITVVDDEDLTLDNLQAKLNNAIAAYNSSLNGSMKLSVVTPEITVVTEFAYAYTEDSINELMYKQTGATSIEVYVKGGKIYTNENGSKSSEALTAANAAVLKGQYGINKLIAEALKFRNEFAFYNSLTFEGEAEGVYTFNLDLETYSGSTFKPAGKESIKLLVTYGTEITKVEVQITNTDLTVSTVTLELLGLEKPAINFPSDLILW